MRTKLRVAALLVALVVVAWWFFGGHHLGFNQNSVPHAEKDPVTGLDYTRYEDRFVPGYEFLAEGLGLAVLLGVASYFFRSKSASKPG